MQNTQTSAFTADVTEAASFPTTAEELAKKYKLKSKSPRNGAADWLN